LIALVTIVAALQASKVTFQNTIEVWFVDDDPALANYEEFGVHFEADETVVLAFDAAPRAPVRRPLFPRIRP